MTVSGTSLVALSQALQRADQAAEGIRKATQPETPGEDHVDLSNEAVRLLTAKNGHDSALSLAKTEDDMKKHLIDLKG